MNETSKMHNRRVVNGDMRLLQGHGIDIGCGPDPLWPTVVRWDWEQGDAQYLGVLEDETFDYVYSSHCLEHMVHVTQALLNWVRVLKPGGYLYVVVPDWALYEKRRWPSQFNGDHKHTFSLTDGRETVGRDNHFDVFADLVPLLRGLGCDVLTVRLEDHGYNYELGPEVDQTMGEAVAQICIIAQKRKSVDE